MRQMGLCYYVNNYCTVFCFNAAIFVHAVTYYFVITGSAVCELVCTTLPTLLSRTLLVSEQASISELAS